MRTLQHFLCSLIIFSICTLNAQNQGYKIIYGKKLLNNNIENFSDVNMRQRILNFRKALTKVEYILLFNSHESYFLHDSNMQSDNEIINPRVISSGGMEGLHYNNIKENIKLSQLYLFDELFIVTEKFNKYRWEILKETKMIDNKVVKKARTTIYVNDFRGNFSFNVEAWFCPEIPVNFGPSTFTGLPGLILELIYDEKIVVFAKRIELLNDVEIPQIIKGKKVSQEELKQIFNEGMNKIKNGEW